MLSAHGKFPWLIEPEYFCEECIDLATKIRDNIGRKAETLGIGLLAGLGEK
jgi:hypothetical protein